jgi:hypothetical protein
VIVYGTSQWWIAPNLWPDEFQWVREKLAIRSGSPRFIVVEGRKIVTHRYGQGAWNAHVLPLIERMVARQAAAR